MRILTSLGFLSCFAAFAPAQCVDVTGGTATGLTAVGADPANDEGVSAPIDMLFGPGGFPMAGAAGPLTHAVVDSNGVLYLTSGGAAVGRALYGPTTVAELRGTAGASPRVFPLWTDLVGPAASWAVRVDTSVPGRFKVNWVDTEQYGSGGPVMRFSAALFDTGVVELGYGTLPVVPWDTFFILTAFAGVSTGNGVGTGAESPVDLTTSPDSGALGLLFQQLSGVVPSFSGTTLTLLPNGIGGYTSIVTCRPPANEAGGAGCYGDTVYQMFPDAALASAGLTGNALVLSPNGTGYSAAWIPGGAVLFVPPTAATDLTRQDDSEQLIDLTTAVGAGAALPTPSGPKTQFYVHSNGYVSLATGNDNAAWNQPQDNYVPTPFFRNAPATAFWAWHDWDPTDTVGGPIRRHYDAVANVFYLTWDGVESYAEPEVANPGTFQFQFDLGSGTVTYVWQSISANTSSIYGSAHLVGYSPGGASVDPGAISFADSSTAITIDGTTPLTLSASPTPQILGSGSSNVITYALSNMPDFAPPGSVRLGILFFSVGELPGVDLGFLGAPGCRAYVNSLDVQFPIVQVGGATQTVALSFPPPLASGLSFFSQAVALIQPGSLPGGQNAFGIVTSNGVETRF